MKRSLPVHVVSATGSSPVGRSSVLHRGLLWSAVVLAFFFAKPISGLDQNSDGLSDIWQQKYSVPSADANLDYNGTGLTNKQKSLLGLDPRDAKARYRLDIVSDSVNNQLRLQLPTVYGKRYQIESSNDLRNWVLLNSSITGTDGVIEFAQPLSSSPTFFRANYAGDIDSDADGLTAWEERELGTSDQNKDTDGDGMPDWWEYRYGLNPLINDAEGDRDGDGRSNLQEYQAGTDPTDYYNGRLPDIAIYAGGDQRGNPGTILPTPISIVLNASGIHNAPVTFAVTQGLGLLAPDNSGTYAGVTSLTVPSSVRYPDLLGFYVAQVYVYLPTTPGNVSVIEAKVATGGSIASVKTTAAAIDPSLMPPTNLLATATSPTTVELSWTMASEVTATIVQATLDDGRTWINLGAAGPGVNRVTVSGLTPDYPVSFRVFSSNDHSGITNSFTIPHDPASAPPPFSGPGGDATAPAIAQPLSQPVVEGEDTFFNLGAWGFSGFLNQNTYLTKTAVLTCDPENSVTYIDRIDPITGRQLPRQTIVTGTTSCFGFNLGEPNTGERTISNTQKLTESLPGDVDDFGRPVHKTLTLTLSDQNDEARLRQNAANKLPPFQGTFGENVNSAYIYVDDSGYGLSALQYRWKVNAQRDLVVKWDVQFRPVNASVQHNVQQWVTNNNTLSPTYVIDPRTLNGGANGYYDVFLLMADLAVDGNRDGEMSFTDPVPRDADKTTSDRPYRFWLNDDDDTEINDGTDGNPIAPAEFEQVPALHADNSFHQIVSKRNLEDFARLWMDTGGAQDALSWGIQIGLKWKNVTGGPAINIYPSADGDGKDDYLRDEAAAQAQISNPIFNEAIRDRNNKQTVDANSTFIFKGDYWADFNPKKCFLFEGASEGKGELTVVFLDANGNELAEGGSVWLEIKEVRKLYERGNITVDAPQIPDPWNNDQPSSLQWAWDGGNWPPEVDAHPADKTIVFVHGWRMTYEDYLSWADTTFKRLHQLGYKGRFYAFHWPTFHGDNNGINPADLYKPGGTTYNPSEYRAWLSGPAFANFVNGLPNPNARYLLAHSMGNVTAGSALRNGMQVTRYAMCNSAMAAMAYDPSIIDDNYATPDTDIDPTTRQTFGLANKVNPAGTEIINFSLPDDYALGQWSVNNEFFKPQSFVDHNYYYHSYEPPGRKLTDEGLVSIRLITSVPEAMGYVTQSRSRAAGAKQSTAGSVGSFVNMGSDGFNFGTEHSAEWVYSIQRTRAFWMEVLRRFDNDVTGQ